jgi:serine/threonine-protein kinase RsbW
MSAQVETGMLRLTLPARAEYLMFTRLVLTGLSRTVEIDPEALADLKLAVSEACSYSIRTGAPEEARLEIAYGLTGESIAVTVRVEGAAALPMEAGDEGDRVEDDLGLVIIEALVNELEIGREDGLVRQISFRKRLDVG